MTARPRRWGLTGGIGSGKSTVTAILRERGIPVFDADAAAREAARPGGAAHDAMRELLGDDVLLPDGSIDREKTARRVFADPDLRRRLEAIVHPVVVDAWERWAAQRAAEEHPLVVVDAPLLFEAGMDRDLDGTIAVVADPGVRTARVAARDGADPAAVRARMAAQMDDAERARRATIVIGNDGTLERLRVEVERAIGGMTRAGSVVGEHAGGRE